MACLAPYVVKDKLNGGTIPVPCGKCPECTKRRVSEWSFRLMQQDKTSHSAMFVTLTYNTDTVPITKRGYLTIVKKDVQDFLKRLRFNTGAKDIKYYAVGEYGGKSWRPHYHLILFNCPSPLDVEKAWTNGSTHFGSVTGASVGYTLKYICKEKRVPQHANDDRLREFSLMSKDWARRTLRKKPNTGTSQTGSTECT